MPSLALGDDALEGKPSVSVIICCSDIRNRYSKWNGDIFMGMYYNSGELTRYEFHVHHQEIISTSYILFNSSLERMFTFFPSIFFPDRS